MRPQLAARVPGTAGCVILTALLLGCKSSKPSAAPAPSQPASAKDNKLKGIGASLPSVGRLEPSTDLQQFGQMYLTEAVGGRPPRSLEDMPDLRRDLPRAYEAIKVGDYVVRWGADPAKAPGGASGTVLAYVREAPVKGGVAVFLDGSVRQATVDEIQPRGSR